MKYLPQKVYFRGGISHFCIQVFWSILGFSFEKLLLEISFWERGRLNGSTASPTKG